MKILHITPEAPGYTSGGRLGVMQTELSITSNNNIVDYIGPEIEYPELAERYNKIFIPSKSKNIIKLAIHSLRGITNKSYESWLKLDVDYSSYDAVVLDFTKQSYILKKVNPNKLIVRVHNVEYDFSNSAYKLKKSLKNYLVKKSSFSQEALLLSKARVVVPLTQNDLNRLSELYSFNKTKVFIVPVCTEPPERIDINTSSNTMIITGSLWFGGNYDGIKWFLTNVYSQLSTPVHLIIAGRHPNEELKQIIKKYPRVSLIDSPDAMAPYFLKASLAIAPVFDGAGMKVKVAEALSYGLPVVGTSHAMIGYEIEDGINSYQADSAKQFVNAIEDYYSKSFSDRLKMREKALQLYEKKYSMQSSIQLWGKLLRKI